MTPDAEALARHRSRFGLRDGRRPIGRSAPKSPIAAHLKELSGRGWKAAARSALAIQIAVRSANRSQNTLGTDEILSGAQWRCPRGRPEGSASSELRSGGRMACAAALPRSAGPAGEEAGDLVGGVPLEGVGADVVAGQGGLRAGVAQQALDVAQRNALIEPDRADGAPERVRPDGPADPGDLRGAGDVAVHRAAAMPAPVRVRVCSSGPLVRPSMAA